MWIVDYHGTLREYVIVGNAACLGAEADLGRTHKSTFMALEHVFYSLFVIELLLHFKVEGWRLYFADRGNWLDFTLVALSVIDVWVIQVCNTEGGDL